jgi:hypothetical protein
MSLLKGPPALIIKSNNRNLAYSVIIEAINTRLPILLFKLFLYSFILT